MFNGTISKAFFDEISIQDTIHWFRRPPEIVNFKKEFITKLNATFLHQFANTLTLNKTDYDLNNR